MSYSPSDATGTSTAERFRQAGGDPFAKEFCLDRPIVKIADWSMFLLGGGETLLNAGSSALTDPNSTLFAGVFIETGDTLAFLWTLPIDIDATEQIDFRILWSSNRTSVSTQPVMLYHPVDVSLGTSSNTMAVGTTALGTAWAGQTLPGTADIPLWTGWGVIAADTTGVKTLEGGDDAICGKVTWTHNTAADIFVYQIQARYTRKYLG